MLAAGVVHTFLDVVPAVAIGVPDAGTVAGAIVGYLPGVSSAIAAVVLAALPAAVGARGFIVATGGVNTANAVCAMT